MALLSPPGPWAREHVGDLALVNATVITLDPRRPRAEAIAVRAGRILHVGTCAEVLALAGDATTIVDGQGGVAVPAFHDAHLHLLSYARDRSRVDCRAARRIADLQALLRARATTLEPGAWVRAAGYDDALLAEGRHPTRRDLDAAVPDRPVRLQHRGRHLDVFNSAALRLLSIDDAPPAHLERDERGEPTGRLYNGAEFLRRPRAAGFLSKGASAEGEGVSTQTGSLSELARDVRTTSDELLSRGITTVQDATFTNSPDELALVQRLTADGSLRVRTVLLRGARYWREFPPPPEGEARLGPIKIMLDEATSDPAAVRRTVAEAQTAGESVALHAVSEAEVAIALDALRAADSPARRGERNRADTAAPSRRPTPNRIEHGGVIPDAWLPELRELGVVVVGQPALVRERGDVYRAAYPGEQHGWLHRARTLLAAGVRYAASSDAPVTEPDPLAGMITARTRLTASGARLGPGERLTPLQALAAFTLWPAQAVGLAGELGQLRRGMIADIAVLDADVLDRARIGPFARTTRLTIMNGQVVWRRPASPTRAG